MLSNYGHGGGGNGGFATMARRTGVPPLECRLAPCRMRVGKGTPTQDRSTQPCLTGERRMEPCPMAAWRMAERLTAECPTLQRLTDPCRMEECRMEECRRPAGPLQGNPYAKGQAGTYPVAAALGALPPGSHMQVPFSGQGPDMNTPAYGPGVPMPYPYPQPMPYAYPQPMPYPQPQMPYRPIGYWTNGSTNYPQLQPGQGIWLVQNTARLATGAKPCTGCI